MRLLEECLPVRWLVGEERREMRSIYVANPILHLFLSVASFPPLAPHTLKNTPDSRETAHPPSQYSLLAISHLCLCRLAFLESRQCHGHNQPAAAVTPTDPHKYVLPLAIFSYIAWSESPPNWWRHYI